MRKRKYGFTLIELLVTMAIIGILAGSAYPAYRKYVIRAARAEARGNILNIAQMEERYYTGNGNGYVAFAGPAATPLPPAGWLNYSGSSLASRKYDISVGPGASANAAMPDFTILATASNQFADPTCGNLTLDSVGNRGFSSASGDMNTCWGK